MTPTSSSSLRALLGRAGYEVVFRNGAQIECLVHRGAERWIGRGDSDDDAIDDALSRMLPSHCARVLLTRAIAASELASKSSSVEAAAPLQTPVADAPVASAAVAPPAAVAPTVVAPSVVAPSAVVAPPAAARAAPVRPPIPPAVREAGAAALDVLLADIEAQLASFARTAPDRQRVHMLLWICRARRVEEGFPGDSDMERRASAIARRLSDLAKMFWPGSVRALQLGARPVDVPELRSRTAAPPKTWAEAVPVAERLLQEMIAEAKAEGLDPEGWVPFPTDPPIKGSAEKTFTEAVATLDTTIAALPLSGKTVIADPPALDKLLVIAKKLRWVRGRVKDNVAWGSAVGRLRKLIPTLKTGGTRIREAIDPRAKPEPW